MNSIPRFQPIRKLRPSLYQMPAGELVGFGPLEARPGNGHSFCYNCNERYCQHVKAVSEAWFGGQSIEQETIVFNGYHADAVPAPPIAQTKVTRADIEATEQGNKPGAWRARSIEEMPSGWTRQVVL